ncbi:hypothetical protein RFI_26877 [Reticulomyxa filosa]|uniref:Uncharacterized protein n=1 Tax=Reticulomyxa filosa TaxID=46433 RepID=X6MAK8_RETFI|nr:hypothetical protein RFI_26877 [Reticulomyxa filosa]|eukprot:ETO10502.1 hypothetical protein RFI_26877 [Reticulomyxa filosa]
MMSEPIVRYHHNKLSVWCPDVSKYIAQHIQVPTQSSVKSPVRDSPILAQKVWIENSIPLRPQALVKEKPNIFFFGHLLLTRAINPNNNIPFLFASNCRDKEAIKPPQQLLQIVRHERVEETKAHRYWMILKPPPGYTALGSVCVEEEEEIPAEFIPDRILTYFEQRHLKDKYHMEYLGCVRNEYVEDGRVIREILHHEKSHFHLVQLAEQYIYGVYTPVPMPFMCLTVPEQKHANQRPAFTVPRWKSQHMIQANSFREGHVPVIADSPLVISYTSIFRCVWTSESLMENATKKLSVWEPVLFPNEYMVGHIAVNDWQHPLTVPNMGKLIIVKTGGNDPEAFKAPLGFKCIWSARDPKNMPQKSKFNKC